MLCTDREDQQDPNVTSNFITKPRTISNQHLPNILPFIQNSS